MLIQFLTRSDSWPIRFQCTVYPTNESCTIGLSIHQSLADAFSGWITVGTEEKANYWRVVCRCVPDVMILMDLIGFSTRTRLTNGTEYSVGRTTRACFGAVYIF